MIKSLLIAISMSVFASAAGHPKEWQGTLVPQATVGHATDQQTTVYKFVDYKTGQQFYVIVVFTVGRYGDKAAIGIHTLPCQ